jgi:hypothetical protein
MPLLVRFGLPLFLGGNMGCVFFQFKLIIIVVCYIWCELPPFGC